MEKLDKVLRLGRGAYGGVYVHIQFDKGRLSLTGVEGPKRNGDALGGAGQIVDSFELKDYAQGWTPEMVTQLKAYWHDWHLNDVQAGNPQQMAWLKANPVSYTFPESHYEAATKALDAVGLNPQGDRYGHKWHTVEVPKEVLDWFAALPDADITPAWV